MVLSQIRTGRKLERVAAKYNFPFQVRPSWPGLDWIVWNETLEDFSNRVKSVTSVLGPADSVEGMHWLGAYAGNDVPDLVATWTVDNVKITIRAMSPKGCRVDPRSEYRTPISPELHPECKAVLKSLEDILEDI